MAEQPRLRWGGTPLETQPDHEKSELLRYVERSTSEEETFHFMGFEFLHRLNIVQLQNELIDMKERVAEVGATEVKVPGERELKDVLHEYTTALRDYNFVHSQPLLDHHNAERRKQLLKRTFTSITTSHRRTRPFETHYYHLRSDKTGPVPDLLRDKLRRRLPSRLSYSAQERLHRGKEFDEGLPPDEISPFVDNLVRLCVATLAILLLVVPMCIMSFRPSTVKSLVTVAAFMVVFACGVSFGVKGSNVETLVATATYSAVLVVFVGTNS